MYIFLQSVFESSIVHILFLQESSVIVTDVALSILCKCLKSQVQRESTDLPLVLTAVETALSRPACQGRIFAMMSLCNYRDQDAVKKHVKLTGEDIQVISQLVKFTEETEDVLLFLDQVRLFEGNSHALRSCGGLELLSKVVDFSVIEKDIEKAAMLLEILLKDV